MHLIAARVLKISMLKLVVGFHPRETTKRNLHTSKTSKVQVKENISVFRNSHTLKLTLKPIPADNFKKYNSKHNPKISILKPEI